MPLVSIRKYAEHRTISHTAVQKAIKQGRIRTTDSKIDVEQADRDWARNTTPAEPAKAPPKAAPTVAPGGATYAQSRAVRELYLARLTKIDYEERTGTLVSKDEIQVAAFNKFRQFRDQLLNIPDRVAAMLAAENEPAKVHEILTGEIRKALYEFADTNS